MTPKTKEQKYYMMCLFCEEAYGETTNKDEAFGVCPECNDTMSPWYKQQLMEKKKWKRPMPVEE